MASLKEILGSNIQVLDDDPITAGAVWASGGDLNAVKAGMGGAGIQTANLSMGGIVTNAPAAGTANTESYNGTSWTEVNNLNNDREVTNGVGLYTAALCMGNDPPYSAAVESWDGTNWTNGTNLPAPRGYGAAFGTQTAAIYTGGYTDGDSSVSGSTLYWNGSSWTETGDLNTTRAFLSSSTNGTYTAAVVFGGPSSETKTESWNGSTWTEVNDLVSASPVATGGGNQTSAFIAKGGVSVTTQTWDGTNWASAADAATAASYSNRGGGGASNAAGIAFGGSNAPAFTTPTFITSTEEFTDPPITATIQQEGQLYFKGGALKGSEKAGGIPSATWSSGGTMNTARQYVGAFGSQTAGLVAGGETSTAVNNVEQYNGTSWTEIAEINTTRYGLEGFGDSYTSGFVTGGAPDKTQTESWNGSAWTEVSDLPQGTERGGCAGTSTSAFYVGGYKYPSPARPTNVGYDWNGSAWAAGNNLNQPRDRMGAAGVITSGIVFGGTSGPPYTERNETELYDGSSWTETGNLNTTRRELGASAFNRTNGLVLGFGGEPPATANTELFNGSSWTEVNNLSTARAAGGGLGTSISAAFAGGSGVTGETEHFTADVTNTTVTSS